MMCVVEVSQTTEGRLTPDQVRAIQPGRRERGFVYGIHRTSIVLLADGLRDLAGTTQGTPLTLNALASGIEILGTVNQAISVKAWTE